ncbi:MAG: HPr(Ser) kinase/phosphatase [Deltaproteobacteria bacterium]|nr:HPr(Ser) kinase/phosphatase [Deltaproteobacteria bacterium]
MLAIPIIQLAKNQEHQLHLRLIAGERGLSKKITIPRIQKPGLALTGDTSGIHTGRLQVLGQSEIGYLSRLSATDRRTIITAICQIDIAGFVVTSNLEPPVPLEQECEKNNIPLFCTHLLTSTFINRVSRFLEDHLTASTCIHGVLLDVFGVGILIIGKSGIGKSECALDLILRGHRLVADDIVNIKKRPPAQLYGTGSEIIKYHMEIRGLGIINIKDLFGIAAIRDRKLIEVVVELMEWDPRIEYDRLGVDDQKYTVLDVHVPYIQIPVRPGRNITTIIEVAARNQLLKLGGHYSAREFQERLNQEIVAQHDAQQSVWEMLE